MDETSFPRVKVTIELTGEDGLIESHVFSDFRSNNSSDMGAADRFIETVGRMIASVRETYERANEYISFSSLISGIANEAFNLNFANKEYAGEFGIDLREEILEQFGTDIFPPAPTEESQS